MSRNPIKYYNEFVNEDFRDDAEKHDIKQQFDDLNTLSSAGLVDKNQINRKKSAIFKKGGGARAVLADPILGQVIDPTLYQAKQSQEWRDLEAAGWQDVSNDRHLFNGTLIISANNRVSGLQITTNRYIRRVFPAGKQRANVIVGNLPGDGVNLYLNAFRWILAMIDPQSDNCKLKRLHSRTQSAVQIPTYSQSRR